MKQGWLKLMSVLVLVPGIWYSASASERPFLFGCGRYAGQGRLYDQKCWDHMANIGVTITTTGLCWSDAEPVKGQYNWDAIAYTDFAVEQIRARGMEPLFFLGLTPRWAALRPDLPPHRSPPKEQYVDEFMRFHRFVANRYKGKVKYYLFWNEPNGCGWIRDGCGNADSYPLYTKWLIRLSRAIKQEDPDAKIIAGNIDYHSGVIDGWRYIKGMYDGGAGPHIDGIAIHPYDPHGTIHWRAITDTRRVMVANGDAHKGIWIMEYGWNTTNYQQTADKLVEVLTELKKPEWHFVQMANYLVLNDGRGVENYGLMDADLNPRPGYYAFRRLAKTLSEQAQTSTFDADISAAQSSKPYYREVMSGAEMKSKLGVLYLMGAIESQGFCKLADSGYLPIVKTGFACRDRGFRVKRRNPKAIFVLAMHGEFDTNAETPQVAAERCWAELEEKLKTIPQENRKMIDFLEFAPNMWEPKTIEQARWYCQFIELIAPKIAEFGLRPVILTSGVGGLPVEPEILDAMVPALQVAKECGGAWACHGYTLQYTMDPEIESWYSLRYRRAYAYLQKNHPEVADLPMILTEGGVDKQGDPDKDGWQARGTAGKYKRWLAWYDKELKKDDYVLGVTLFKIGAPSIWRSFDLEPIAPALLNYLKTKHGASKH